MGSINSIPVVSQVKSLVQVIGGDAEGAKRTQVEFSRTAPIVSQVNSLAHVIKGDAKEAKKIAEEGGNSLLTMAENLPVVGHVTAGVYAATGDLKKAESVALGATKSTVVAAAGIAGAACGPAAAVCGGTFALEANALWDVSESAIAGEHRGMVKQIDNAISGNMDIGEGFDLAAGQTLTAVGGAASAVSASNFISGKGKVGAATPKKICKRSAGNELIFHQDLPPVPANLAGYLPGSLHDLEVANEAALSSLTLVNSVVSIVLVMKMMIAGHPKSRPYFRDICTSIYPSEDLAECEYQLLVSLNKYNDEIIMDDPDEGQFVNELLDSLVFEAKKLTENSTMTNNLVTNVCIFAGDKSKREFAKCKQLLDRELAKVDDFVYTLSQEEVKIRVKRCPPGGLVDDIAGAADDIAGAADDIAGAADDIAGAADDIAGAADDIAGAAPRFEGVWPDRPTYNFKSKHVVNDDFFDGVNLNNPADVQNLGMIRNDGAFKNTLMKASDIDNVLQNLDYAGSEFVHGTKMNHFVSKNPVDIIQITRRNNGQFAAQKIRTKVEVSTIDGRTTVHHFNGLA